MHKRHRIIGAKKGICFGWTIITGSNAFKPLLGLICGPAMAQKILHSWQQLRKERVQGIAQLAQAKQCALELNTHGQQFSFKLLAIYLIVQKTKGKTKKGCLKNSLSK